MARISRNLDLMSQEHKLEAVLVAVAGKAVTWRSEHEPAKLPCCRGSSTVAGFCQNTAYVK